MGDMKAVQILGPASASFKGALCSFFHRPVHKQQTERPTHTHSSLLVQT